MVGNLKLSTGSQLVKYLMFIFNLIFVMTGIILVSIGSVIHGVYYEYQHFLDNRFFSVPSLLIAVGSIIFFIAFFGCCGAIKENYCMIITFATLMVLVFIMELSAGISGYVLRNEANEVLKDKMNSTMKNYKEKGGDIESIWKNIQRDFKCCGTTNPREWTKALGNETPPGWLPLSCCEIDGSEIGTANCTLNSPTLHQTGCLPAVAQFIESHALQLGGAGIGIAFMQALGIWFSIYLAKSIKGNYDNMQ